MPPISTLLRAFEGPAPWLVIGADGAATSLQRSLAAHEVPIAATAPDSEAIAAALRAALDRGRSMTETMTRAAAFSAAQTVERAARRLAASPGRAPGLPAAA